MIKLFFCGDIVNRQPIDNSLIDEKLLEVIKAHDIKCCNFEAPIVQNPSEGKSNKIGPTVYQTEETAKSLIEAGFNLFSIANNHIMDYGKEGLKNTLECFKGNNVIGAGMSKEEAYKIYRYEKENIKISFLSIAENGFGSCTMKSDYGYAWMQDSSVEEIIKKEKDNTDFLIINCHAGAEMFSYPLPEIKELYKKFIDWGADIIIGHHPHVIQGYENYKEGTIFYSLGNFIFDTMQEKKCKTSYGVSIKVKNKNEYSFEIIPCIYEKGKVFKNIDGLEKDIIKYSSILNTNEYYDEVNTFCNKTYKQVYVNYYEAVCGISTNTIKGKIKSCIKILLNKNKFNNLFLYHNIAIETHLWICSRALNNIIKGGKQ